MNQILINNYIKENTANNIIVTQILLRFYLLSDISDEIRKFIGILINSNIEFGILGGAVRDWILNKTPKDIDIVLNGDSKKLIDELTSKFTFRRTGFGGYSFYVDKMYFDVWNLEDAWAFQETKIYPSWENLLGTVPFNVDGILVTNTGKLFNYGFFESLKSKTISMIYLPNKFSKKFLAQRALRFSDKYKFSLDKNLKEYLETDKYIYYTLFRDIQKYEHIPSQ